ncbi:hypothetical protein BDV12DRAFT_200502 [Aspergillus spectabilis]
MLQDELQQLRLASHPRSGSLERLASLLEHHAHDTKQPWLAMDILRCYQDIWLRLPTTSRDGQDATTNNLISRVRQQMKDGYTPFADLLRDDPRPALIDPSSNTQASHATLRRFMLDFDLRLPYQGQGKKPRVAVMLPNGPILALACLAIANRYTMVPMARTVAPEQLRADIDAVHADAILMLEADAQKVQLDDLPVFVVQPKPELTFTATATSSSPSTSESAATDNDPDDVAILLFTSGTSGTKKLVPITTYNLFASAVFTMDSVALDEGSRCLNMMPLHHIGGMVRSLYAPMLAGSSTVCCASFDANLFWDVVEAHAPTWYYATPTMHQMILSESEHRPDAVTKALIRFICNAGGGLPATLAVQLREVFECVVLPSYGMTECAPIAAPEKDYDLGRVGTSGRPVGPNVAILSALGETVNTGTTGRICVRGFPVFLGYLRLEGLDTSVFDAPGWFDTGDLGHVDSEGYLFITRRSKEVINRGGEIISPLEVEDAILSAARDPEKILFVRVSEMLAFSTRHDILQEAVGSAGSATGQRLGMDTLSDSVPVAERHFEAQCPPTGTALTVSIPQRRCLIDGNQVQEDIARLAGTDVVMRHNPIDGFPQAILFKPSATPITLQTLIHSLRPTNRPHQPTASAPFASALNQSIDDTTAETDSFLAGGDSLSAGKLISTLRREFSIKLSGDVLFLNSTVAAITAIIEKSLAAKATTSEKGEDAPLPGCTETRSSTNPFVLLLNLVPMLIFFLLRVGFQWTIFVYIMAETARRFPLDDMLIGRLVHIVLVGLASRIAIGFVAPIAGIIFKWVIMCGRYKPGLYPMWGEYHMRWWLAQKAVRVAGKGVFNYFDTTRVLYYRALGAHIGRDVRIHEHASLGEYDLITLGDGVVLENCIVRPFAVERNTSMLLSPIAIGSNASIGLRTVIAPGSSIAGNTHLGPNSSSWRFLLRIPRDTRSALELESPPHRTDGVACGFRVSTSLAGDDMLRVIVYWFTDPGRIGWHILVRIFYAVTGPLVWFAAILILKGILDVTCGRSKTGPVSRMSSRQNVRQNVRQAALFRLLPGGSLGPLTRLIGKHYELVSVALRRLGVKAGKRIYWPSVGPGIQDFDLDRVEAHEGVEYGEHTLVLAGDCVDDGGCMQGWPAEPFEGARL